MNFFFFSSLVLNSSSSLALVTNPTGRLHNGRRSSVAPPSPFTPLSLFEHIPRHPTIINHLSSSPNNGDIQSIHPSSSSSFNIQQYFNFPLDDWQLQAGNEIIQGNNVITCAPTGAGKTVVGEIALHYAFVNNKDSIYTTPLKALSNQKFMELRKIFGVENVGLSTGDMSINRGAKVMVMTTEVYRNMAWRASSSGKMNINDDGADYVLDEENDLANLSIVVLDEFHYMGQPGRGGVWEECVITSPNHTQIVGLSATLPNAEGIADWMSSVSKQTTLIEALGARPVPLRYMFATRDGLEFLFKDKNAGPGSPNGLLGLRGDGVPYSSSKSWKKNEDINAVPKGLGLNPTLKSLLQRQSEKINRMIARKSIQSDLQNDKTNNRKRDGSRNDNEGRRRRAMSAREEQRERERLVKSEMRKSVPSLHFLLRKLEQKSLLPAIFFIFSRAGCDSAAETICEYMRKESKVIGRTSIEATADYDDSSQRKRRSRRRGDVQRRSQNSLSEDPDLLQDGSGRRFRRNSNYISEDSIMSIFEDIDQEEFMRDLNPLEEENFQGYVDRGLLTVKQVREVAARVKAFNKDNAEIGFSDNIIDQFLHGVGSHHAGQLPAHKAFVETLFRAQLMKVVFATETLAAGINMPARTTVICSMAKRGDGQSMNLLETSNMLQMAGRAGRRGMDTEGTCVVVSTPFEGPNEAIEILTSPIKPIKSQFSPSYSLAVNLIARGSGQLDVAQKLVRKSFAMWEKQQAEQKIESVKLVHGDEYDDVVERAIHIQFLDHLQRLVEDEYSMDSKGQKVLEILKDKNLLKKASKSFSGLNQILELELNTLNYLQQEEDSLKSIDIEMDEDGLLELMVEDSVNVKDEIESQKKRIEKVKIEMSMHVMSAMTFFANDLLNNPKAECDELRAALAFFRKNSPEQDSMSNVSTMELCTFSKSSVQSSRSLRKQQKASEREGIDSSSLLAHLNNSGVDDDAWDDMLSLVNVLLAYGCLVASGTSDNLNDQSFKITVAGENVASLGLDNSLWILVAMGGAWDVKGDSSKLDEFRNAMKNFDSFDGETFITETTTEPYLEEKNQITEVPLPQLEAATLVDLLRSLEPSEIAGYVSALVADGFRGGNTSVVSYFQNLTPTQQKVIQSSLTSLERLMEVQNKFAVDESSSKVQLELGACEVVTAWAAGCSWNEALEISGLQPGDLVRTLHRALDALRQLGNISINAARSLGSDTIQTESPGLHPDIRTLCRDAANAMDRYPVKDPLPFDEEDNEDEAMDHEGKNIL